ncbi:MAG: TetR/AcrR family transcriptional regulator [Microbacteriaceae bacterium]
MTAPGLAIEPQIALTRSTRRRAGGPSSTYPAGGAPDERRPAQPGRAEAPRCVAEKIEADLGRNGRRADEMDPRLERTRKAGLSAAIGLLTEGGLTNLTHQNVSRASGLGRTTVYRHWPTTPHLVLDLLETFRMPNFEPVDGDLPARLLHNVELQHERLLDPDYAAVYRMIQGAALDDEVRPALVAINGERVESVVAVLKPDYDLTGQREDVITLFALINGPLVQLATFTGASSPKLAPAVVHSVLAYLGANCAAGRTSQADSPAPGAQDEDGSSDPLSRQAAALPSAMALR